MTWVCKLKSSFPKLLLVLEFVVAVLIYLRHRVKLEQHMCICLPIRFFINLSNSFHLSDSHKGYEENQNSKEGLAGKVN